MAKKNNIQRNASARPLGMWRKCYECQTWTWDTCVATKKPISQCEHKDRLQYIAALTVPGTKRRIVRVLSQDYAKALEKFGLLKQQLAAGVIGDEPTESSQHTAQVPTPKQKPKQEPIKPTLLIHIFGKYIAWLENQGVAKHLIRKRGKPHIDDNKNCFRKFCIALKQAGYDLSTYRFADFNDDAVGAFHEYLERTNASPRTYNKFFSFLSSFSKWADNENLGDIRRYINRVPRKNITYIPLAITKQEFDAVLAAITPENSPQYNVGKRKETRHHYAPYLKDFFRFSLAVGRRIEELLAVTYNDIIEDENSIPRVIRFYDFKVAHIKKFDPKSKPLYSPVTREVAQLLEKFGYEKHKGTDRFILAPDEIENRIDRLRITVGRAFSHFYQKAFPNSERQLTFKSLRKAFMTSMGLATGRITDVSGHASQEIVDRHYIDPKQKVLAESLADFSVFESLQPSQKKTSRTKNTGNKSIER